MVWNLCVHSLITVPSLSLLYSDQCRVRSSHVIKPELTWTVIWKFNTTVYRSLEKTHIEIVNKIPVTLFNTHCIHCTLWKTCTSWGRSNPHPHTPTHLSLCMRISSFDMTVNVYTWQWDICYILATNSRSAIRYTNPTMYCGEEGYDGIIWWCIGYHVAWR